MYPPVTIEEETYKFCFLIIDLLLVTTIIYPAFVTNNKLSFEQRRTAVTVEMIAVVMVC